MTDVGTQCRSPPEPGATPLLYRFIRSWFRLCAAGFYATTEVHGAHNVPENGVPTICTLRTPTRSCATRAGVL